MKRAENAITPEDMQTWSKIKPSEIKFTGKILHTEQHGDWNTLKELVILELEGGGAAVIEVTKQFTRWYPVDPKRPDSLIQAQEGVQQILKGWKA